MTRLKTLYWLRINRYSLESRKLGLKLKIKQFHWEEIDLTLKKSKTNFQRIKIQKRGDCKLEDSSLKYPGFNPRLRQENLKNIISCFEVALEPVRSTSKYPTYWGEYTRQQMTTVKMFSFNTVWTTMLTNEDVEAVHAIWILEPGAISLHLKKIIKWKLDCPGTI